MTHSGRIVRNYFLTTLLMVGLGIPVRSAGRTPTVDYFYDIRHAATRDGRSRWSDPKRIFEGYVGALNGVLQLESGWIEGGPILAKGRWHTLRLSGDLNRNRCSVAVDGKTALDLPRLNNDSDPLSYLRLRSSATSPDPAGMLIERVAATRDERGVGGAAVSLPPNHTAAEKTGGQESPPSRGYRK